MDVQASIYHPFLVPSTQTTLEIALGERTFVRGAAYLGPKESRIGVK